MVSSQVRSQDKDELESRSIDNSYRRLSSRENIAFDNDVWDLSFRSNIATRSATRVSFTNFPDIVKYQVKQYVRDGILGANLSNSWALRTVRALKQAFQLLAEKHGSHFSLLSLTQDDACIIEELFCQEGNINPREKIATVARFTIFLREQYPSLPANFRLNPRAAPSSLKRKRTYSEGLEQVIPDEVTEALMEAVGREQILLEERIERYHSKRPRSYYLHTVILTLLLCSGRRISEIILLSRNCFRKPTHSEAAEAGQGIWLIYSNTKTGLEQEEIFIGEPISDLVYRMVERVQALTEPLALASGLDRLFLTDPKANPSMNEDSVYIVDAKAFRNWLNGRMTEDERILQIGFIHRYNIKYGGKYYQIDPHQARHTLAHKAYLGGATYVDIGGHLGHIHTQSGLSPMTGVYIHGHEKDVQLIDQMNANRTVVGRAAPLIHDRSVVLKALSPADVAIWREQGMVLHPTHYGH